MQRIFIKSVYILSVSEVLFNFKNGTKIVLPLGNMISSSKTC